MNFKKVLLLCVAAGSLLLGGCNNATTKRYTVHFDTNTNIQHTPVDDQIVKAGMHAKKPNCISLDDDYETYIVFGWYTEKTFENEWNFKKYYPTKNMTLYAKWGFTYDINYYVGNEHDLVKVDTVRSGSYIKEDLSLANGFKYEGAFQDEDFLEPFDFTKPINKDTNIYIRRSDGIYLSETNSTGALSSYLEPFKASADESNPAVLGDATPYTTQSGETYTMLDFGYSPKVADPFFQIELHVDISKSQILRFTMKNLGNSTVARIYFTSFMNVEDEVYSATGKFYTEKYCAEVKNLQTNMNAEDDEWLTLDFDLSAITKDGYSVWGASTHMAKIRFQSSYRSVDKNDRSNKFLIKSIEGIYKEIVIDDSADVKQWLDNDEQSDIDTASEAQSGNNGFIFPKDLDLVSQTTTDAKVYKRKEGLLMYSDNEVALSKKDYTRSIITIAKPTDNNGNILGDLTDLDDNSTLDLTLRNFGYQTSISVYIYNDIGDLVVSDLIIDTLMNNFKTYSINLYKFTSMTSNLSKVEIRYTAVGINNAILIKSIDFSTFKKNDIAGINFNDKACAEISGVEGIEVSFNRNRLMTRFDVTDSSASVTSNTLTKYTNTTGYTKFRLQAVVLASSLINTVTVDFVIGGKDFTATFELDRSLNGKIQTVDCDMDLDIRGDITSYTFSFDGTGTIYIGKIATVNEEDSPFFIDFNNDFSSYIESYWRTNLNYSYDSENECSIFSNTDGTTQFSYRFHIGHLAQVYYPHCPYVVENPLLEGKTKIMFIYQNRSSQTSINIGLFLSDTPDGTGDENIGAGSYNLPLQANMEMYDWAVTTHDFTATELEHRLGKIAFDFNGEIRLRAIVIE